MPERHPIPDMLFVPGIDEAKLEKMWQLTSSGFVMDLEDAVAIERKPAARKLVGEHLDRAAAADDDGHRLYVRMNGLTTSHALADLRAVVRPGLIGLMIPKVASARDVQVVDWVVTQLEGERGMAPGRVELLASLESAQGLLNAREIARCSPRLRCLSFGAGDLSADLGVPLQHAESGTDVAAFVMALKAGLVIASREAGIEPPHDGAYTQYRNLEGLRRSTETDRAIGFSGRHAIHPDQVPVIAEVFRPSAEEVEWAERIVSGFQAQEAAGNASMTIGEDFVDYAIAARAEGLLELARRGGT